jgi:hypothetical protein
MKARVRFVGGPASGSEWSVECQGETQRPRPELLLNEDIAVTYVVDDPIVPTGRIDVYARRVVAEPIAFDDGLGRIGVYTRRYRLPSGLWMYDWDGWRQ